MDVRSGQCRGFCFSKKNRQAADVCSNCMTHLKLGFDEAGATAHERVKYDIAWFREGPDCFPSEERREPGWVTIEVVRVTGNGFAVLYGLKKFRVHLHGTSLRHRYLASSSDCS